MAINWFIRGFRDEIVGKATQVYLESFQRFQEWGALPDADTIGLFGAWEGYRVGTVVRFKAGELGGKGGEPEVLIGLTRSGGPMICSGCGGSCDKPHDWEERWIRDLPILDAQTHLCVQRFRMA